METVWRVTFVYLFLMFAFRTLGKRDIGQLAPFDLVILLMIPELVAQALVGEDYSLINALVGVATLLVLVFLTSTIAYLRPGFDDLVEGRPTVLVHNGSLIPEAMHRERVSPEQILTQMRDAGLEHLAGVKWAILETDGKISFVPDDGEDARLPLDAGRRELL